MNIAELRQEYTRDGLSRHSLADAPIDQFQKWFQQALDAGIREPNAMSLATCGSDLCPSLRTVLLKHFDANGFVFFTNYESKKAKQIESNPHVSLLFPWIDFERQVIIEGVASKIPTSESLKYFVSRPQGSQLGAWASPQSRIIESRRFLEMQLEKMKLKFKEGKVPVPDHWGGYRVVPKRFEFWQGRASRLHDRFEYLKAETQWSINRLAP